MLLLISILLGWFVGWKRASARGGDRLDKLQYGAVHGVLFGLVAVIITVIAHQLGLY